MDWPRWPSSVIDAVLLLSTQSVHSSTVRPNCRWEKATPSAARWEETQSLWSHGTGTDRQSSYRPTPAGSTLGDTQSWLWDIECRKTSRWKWKLSHTTVGSIIPRFAFCFLKSLFFTIFFFFPISQEAQATLGGILCGRCFFFRSSTRCEQDPTVWRRDGHVCFFVFKPI